MSDLKMKVETPDKSLTVLRLNGEFENMAVINAKDELFGHLNAAKTSDFILDFAEISYIDSAGVGTLLEMAKTAKDKGVKFGLVNVQDPVKKVLLITKVDVVLKLY